MLFLMLFDSSRAQLGIHIMADNLSSLGTLGFLCSFMFLGNGFVFAGYFVGWRRCESVNSTTVCSTAGKYTSTTEAGFVSK